MRLVRGRITGSYETGHIVNKCASRQLEASFTFQEFSNGERHAVQAFQEGFFVVPVVACAVYEVKAVEMGADALVSEYIDAM